MSKWLKIFEIVPKSAGCSTLSNALTMAFIILSKEKRSLDPSRLVIVKFLISIISDIVLFFMVTIIRSFQFRETFSKIFAQMFPVLGNRTRLQRYNFSLTLFSNNPFFWIIFLYKFACCLKTMLYLRSRIH